MTLRKSLALFTVAVVCLTGCRSAYYSAWEKFGKHKRDLLKDNVEKVRDDQQQAAEQFKDALTRLKELYGFQGGDLEKIYNRLNSDYERSNQQAETVRGRMRNVEQIAAELFKGGEAELPSITSTTVRGNRWEK